MDLLEINQENLEISISPEAALVKEFKALIDRDNTVFKKRCKKELAVVRLLSLYKSPYDKYKSDEAKLEAAAKDFGIEIDSLVLEAIARYQDMVYGSDYIIRMIHAAKNATQKTENFFNNLDYSLVDKGNKPIYKPKEVLAAIKEVPIVLKGLEEAEQRVREGMKTKATISKGKREVTSQEIPSNINRVKEEDI